MDQALPRAVFERAAWRCEYCRLRCEHQSSVTFYVEHIIARQRNGDDSLSNLALACHRCNLHKGPNLTGLDPQTGELSRLFHPRQDFWSAHFVFRQGNIAGLTAIGPTTSSLLQMNTPDRIELRLALDGAGLWD